MRWVSWRVVTPVSYRPRRRGDGWSPRGRVAGYGPVDLNTAYNITTGGSSSTIVAIVDAFGYDNAEADLGTYRANFGLSP